MIQTPLSAVLGRCTGPVGRKSGPRDQGLAARFCLGSVPDGGLPCRYEAARHDAGRGKGRRRENTGHRGREPGRSNLCGVEKGADRGVGGRVRSGIRPAQPAARRAGPESRSRGHGSHPARCPRAIRAIPDRQWREAPRQAVLGGGHGLFGGQDVYRAVHGTRDGRARQ